MLLGEEGKSVSPPFETRKALQYFFRTTFKRSRLFVSVLLTTFILIVVVTYLISPVYETTASILVQMERLPVSPFPDISPSSPIGIPAETGTNLLNTYAKVLTSRDMAEEMARKFHLDRPREIRNLRDAIHAFLKRQLDATFTLLDHIGILKYSPDPFRAAVDDLKEELTAEVSENSEIIVLTTRYKDAEKTQRICEAIAESLIRRTVEMSKMDTTRMLRFVESELPSAKQALLAAESRVRGYEQREGIGSMDEMTKTLVDRLDTKENELASARTTQQESRRRLQQVQNQLRRQNAKIITASNVENNAIVQQLRQTLYDQERELTGLLLRYTEKHPDVVQMRSKIEHTRQEMRREVRRILGTETQGPHPEFLTLLDRAASLETDAIGSSERERALQQSLTHLQERVRALPIKQQTLVDLQRKQTEMEAIYNQLVARANQLRVMYHSDVPPQNIRIIDPPKLPKSKDVKKPPYLVIILLTPFICLATALFGVFFSEYWDNSIKSREEAESLLGLPVLAIVPPAPGEEKRRRRRRAT